MSIRLLIRDWPSRSIALATSSHALIFRSSGSTTAEPAAHNFNASSTSLPGNGPSAYKIAVEFAPLDKVELEDYRSLSSLSVYGTLGLITLQGEVFLCVVSAAAKTAAVRPGETVQRIIAVEFHCLSSSNYDHILNDEINPYPTDTLGDDGFEYGSGQGKNQGVVEHPAMALKKLLSSGTFYYSADFDLTKRIQDRMADEHTIALDSLEGGFLWNSYMIQPLVDFRSRLSQREKSALDASKILTSAIRGFAYTINIPASSSPARTTTTGLASALTLISRLSCRRAGTRFNSRGIDDDGNVANFVETETIFWSPSGICFSYVQVRGSVPIFWEQATGLLPGQQKITVTRSAEATQPAFDKHFEGLEVSYGAVHVVNLLSHEKPGEIDLAERYHYHIRHSVLNRPERDEKGDVVETRHQMLMETEYDFHAETKGPTGYEAANGIRRYIQDSADGFAYFLCEDVEDHPSSGDKKGTYLIRRPVPILHQEGVFRTNCLDCLDRTNLVQTIVSQMALEEFLGHRSERGSPDFWMRHSSLWADNGDTLSKIYAGTGALKSSFTRSGKMSLAGALADVRKSATRAYINNFADKGRQNTIDMLLGRLIEQKPVHLFDPINDYVQMELNRRAGEYSSTSNINILVATFNLNGKAEGLSADLSPWLCPKLPSLAQKTPEIVAVGFQEIVELSPQQIMSTDPAPRQAWEHAVVQTLNENAKQMGEEEYVLLRGGQLVGASLSVFVKAGALPGIKNVEGAVKKTGLSGMAGNKGAVAIRMEYRNTSICLVTAHLAAGFANYEERNRDYKTISHGLRFQRNRSIEDHDTVIWLGDFNYRIGLSDDKVRRLIEVGDLETLYKNDQLNLQMVYGLTFPYYSEARITFDPTYKYDLGTDNYDSSDKQRIPAWCDRVLRKGDNLRQIAYDAAPLKFSDHRPVFASFECTISIIDEKRREKMNAEIYKMRKASLGARSRIGSLVSDGLEDEDEDEEELLGYDPIEPGLPPASSDKRKWWLDNGYPARSTVVPPKNGMAPNPHRPANPFTPSSEPDWVHVERDLGAPRLPPRTNTSSSVSSTAPSSNGTVGPPRQIARRRVPPPMDPSKSFTPPPDIGRRPMSQIDSISDVRRSQLDHSPAQTPQPPPPRRGGTPLAATTTASPPGPHKLQKTQTASTLSSASTATLAPGPAPGKLRKTPSPSRQGRGNEAGVIPALPPRRGTGGPGAVGNVMDLDDEGDREGLRDWEVLRPGQ
ncbi:hypothetical protein NA57DRAFT_38870 [Rhizodiscina lignyota]|uniref:phosphoinositide 5-phosphatase n=1 Tax=Rhizodiscina lignyota TaxID=1504668 RepID=A0A9P4M6D3_9PEZI|nr:hypothetical protein NA57DRAFT_38870 [Rhizodiscina lignyota]